VNPDFVIVGAGVIGLATAWELAAAGASVTLLDRGPAGREASWAGAGILSPLDWDYPPAVTDLAAFGAGLYPAWTDALRAASGIDAEYQRCGLLLLPPADFDAALTFARRAGSAAQMRRGREVAPAIAADESALYLADVAQVRNPRLLRALRGALTAAGVELVEHCAVTGLALSGRRCVGVRTRGGIISAGAVIVAAGAWSAALCAATDAVPEVYPVRGQMLLFKAERGLLPTIVMQGDHYLVPRRDGHILAGATVERVGFDKSTTDSAARGLRDFAAMVLPQLGSIEPVAHWAGLRPGSPGNVPFIGAHPTLAGLWLNCGHFRYGLTMAPGAARLLADQMLGRTPPYALRARAPAGAALGGA